jgi:hypothetical protein
VLAGAGIYYPEDDADDCAEKILALIRDAGRYSAVSREARAMSACFPNAAEWAQRYLDLL